MKYISCRKCGHYVSNQATTCPACGESINKPPAAVQPNEQNVPGDIVNAAQKDPPERSWIKKLWYGEYSMPTVFWLFGIVAGITGWYLGQILGILLDDADASFKTVAIIICLSTIMATAYNVVLIVGAWRTSNKHNGSKITRFLFRVWVLIVLLSTFILIAYAAELLDFLLAYDLNSTL